MDFKPRKVVKFAVYAGVFGAGIYIGKKYIDPVTVIKTLDRSSDLWLKITPEAIHRLKDGKTAVVFEKTPAGNLLVMKLANEQKTVSDLGVSVIERAGMGKEAVQAVAA